MRKTYKFKVQSQSNTIKLGNMLDDMWDIHVHIMHLQRWQWKLATRLCSEWDILCFETLNIEGMKRLWGRKVSDYACYQFIQILEQKCAKHDKIFVQIGQWTPTTKPCSDCGHRNENLSLSDRQWTCPKCGSHHDRDINAAINIKQAGLAALSGAVVSPSL